MVGKGNKMNKKTIKKSLILLLTFALIMPMVSFAGVFLNANGDGNPNEADMLPIGFIVTNNSAHNSGTLAGQIPLADAPASHVIGWVFSSFTGYIVTSMVQSGGQLSLGQIPVPIAEEGYFFAGWRPWVATTSPSETFYIEPGDELFDPITSVTGIAPVGTGYGPMGDELFSSEALTEFRNVLGTDEDDFISWSIIFIAYFTPVEPPPPPFFTVTFQPGTNGTLVGGTPNITLRIPEGTTLTTTHVPGTTPNEDWLFNNWNVGNATLNPVGHVVTADVTFVAQWRVYGSSPDTGINGFLVGALALTAAGITMFTFVKKADKANV